MDFTSAEPIPSQARATRRRQLAGGSLRLLLPAVVLLPLAMNAAAAYLSWRQTWAEAAAEMTRTAEAAAEYARRVFDGMMLRIDRADDILAGLDDDTIRRREPELHEALGRASTTSLGMGHRPPYIFVFDRDAFPLVSGNLYPVPRGRAFTHREFNQALRGDDAPGLHISPVYIGSVNGQPFFSVTRRRVRTGNGLPTGAYDGVINASVNVNEANAGLRRLAGPQPSDLLALIREDGLFLARSAGPPVTDLRLRDDDTMLAAMQRGEIRALRHLRSGGDDTRRLGAFRRVDGYPVFATAARDEEAVIAQWRRTVAGQLAVGLPATLALLGLSFLVLRRNRDLATSHAELEARVAQRTAALAESEARLRLAQEAGGVGLWDWDIRTGHVFWSDRYFRVMGLDPNHVRPSYESFLAAIDPQDRAQVQANLEAARANPDAYTYREEFRLPQPDGSSRWILEQGEFLRAPLTGEALRLVGVCLDVTERRRSEERLRLLAREVDHRAKNALAVVQAAVRLAPKEDAAGFTRAIEGRVMSLARVHNLLAEGRWAGADLRELAASELSAFILAAGDSEATAPRVEAQGPAVQVGPAVAQAVCMVLHELATNAVKYGALSAAGGLVRLSWEVAQGDLRLRWAETGGPPITAPPQRRGFGSRVLTGTIQSQLGGTVHQDWDPTGLVCRISIPLSRLTQG
ncbi:sensor histidine kinase [Belnapia rosea]|uniref:histidine kinase n=1 Tax=Belnapia rosea TaxID=938405 RepID=A0A1G6LJ43_9PROT|nr:HWE histidine kinase domain-containing protein [Belnapia rosea]SDC43300.1 PAS domain S-box-containing protein [Belnapia rosea]